MIAPPNHIILANIKNIKYKFGFLYFQRQTSLQSNIRNFVSLYILESSLRV